MTDPSAEAFFPTMITVQPSLRMSVSTARLPGSLFPAIKIINKAGRRRRTPRQIPGNLLFSLKSILLVLVSFGWSRVPADPFSGSSLQFE
jgi:hypothetical protein